MPDHFARFVSVRSVFVEDAAVLLGVSRRTIYYRIRDGKLATIRTRGGSQRVLVESIGALLRQQRRARQARARIEAGTAEEAGVRALTDGA
jgi:excisionase family DNA binding protein